MNIAAVITIKDLEKNESLQNIIAEARGHGLPDLTIMMMLKEYVRAYGEFPESFAVLIDEVVC